MAIQENISKGNRVYFLDNLKTFIIFLVILYHAGWVYERSGILSSLWIVNDPSKNDLSGILNIIIDMFVMQVMFFISGYFTPLSVNTKSGWGFIKYRFKRLMIPWIIAVFTLIPLYKVIFLYSRDLPQENFFSFFHFTGGVSINQGWLWFLPVLFLFDIIYQFLSKVNLIKIKFGIKGAVSIICIIGFIYSFCMSIFKCNGWTKTLLLDFQNEKILIYFMMFLLGAFCYKLNIFNLKPGKKKLYYVLSSVLWIPMFMYIIILINYVYNPGKYILSEFADGALFFFCFYISMLGLMYIIINTFRYYLNKKGMILQRLANYSFGVYIIHFIVLGAIAAVLLKMDIPSISKYFILTISAFIICNLIISFYKEIIKKLSENSDKI